MVAREAQDEIEERVRELARQPVSALAPKPAELLARVPFFENLRPEDLDKVVRCLQPRTVLRDEAVIRQGERGSSLFLIARGVIAVYVSQDGSERRVASLYAGDFFGEMALLTAERRTATVRAVTDCQLYELSKADVDAVCEVCDGVGEALVEAAERRRSALMRRRSSQTLRMPVLDE